MAANAKESDYEFGDLERYYGGVEEVVKIMEECPDCHSKLIITHYSDSENLLMQETAKCVECDFGQRKLIHIIS